MIYYATFKSPIGLVTLTADSESINGLHIAEDRYFGGVESDWVKGAAHPILKSAQEQLQQYFAGQRQVFDLPIVAKGTDFQQQVWGAVISIPLGSTQTYIQIATQLGRPTSARAVGSAIGRNPVCLLIPCHRVVTSDGRMGGYVAGVEKKEWLLALERRTAGTL